MIIGGLETESITVRDKKTGNILVKIEDENISYDDQKVVCEEKLPDRFENGFPDTMVEVGDILEDKEGNYYEVYAIGDFFNVMKLNEHGIFTMEGQRAFPNNNKIWTLKEFGLKKLPVDEVESPGGEED